MTSRQLQALRSFRWWRHRGLTPRYARVMVHALFQDESLADTAYLLGA